MKKTTKILIASCASVALVASIGSTIGITISNKKTESAFSDKSRDEYVFFRNSYENAYVDAQGIKKLDLENGAKQVETYFPILEKKLFQQATIEEVKRAIFHISKFKAEALFYNESVKRSNDAFEETQKVLTSTEVVEDYRERQENLYSTYETKWNMAHSIIETKLIPNAKLPTEPFPKLHEKISTLATIEEIEAETIYIKNFITAALKYNVSVSRANSAYLANPGVFANGDFQKEFDPILRDPNLSQQYLNIFGDIKEVPRNALQSALDLQKMLQNSTDIKWHLTGDNVVDAFNAIRYAIAKWAVGDNEAKNKLKTFIDYTFPGSRVSTRHDNGFVAKAKNDINNWLNSNDVPIFLVSLSHLGEVHKVDGDSNYHIFPFLDKENGGTEFSVKTNLQGSPAEISQMTMLSKERWAKMEPLRLSLPHLQQAQLRSQMMDWLGHFDGHDAHSTMQKISSDEITEGSGVYASKPNISYEIKGWGIGENLLVPFRYKIAGEETDDDAINRHGGLKFDFIEGLLTAVMTLYDYNDGSQTTGHRTACFDPALDSVGWNVTFAKPNSYLFFITGNNAEYFEGSVKSIAETDLRYPWLKTLFPNGEATKIVSQFGMAALIRMIFYRFGQVDHDYTDWFFNGHLNVLDGLENAKITSLTDLKDWLDQYYKLGGYGAQAFLRISSPAQLKTQAAFYCEVSKISDSTAVYNPLHSGTVYGEYAKYHGFEYSKLPIEIT